jgi:hypothetical protein
LAVPEVDILHAKAKTFEEAQPASIQEMGHEAEVSLELHKNRAGLGPSKHYRKLGRAPDAFDAGNEVEFSFEDLSIKKQ